MSAPSDTVELETVLDAPLAKVMRVLSIPAYAEQWLGRTGRAGARLDWTLRESRATEVTWHLREEGGNGEIAESLVTFAVAAEGPHATRLLLSHVPVRLLQPANTAAPIALAA